MKKAYTIEQQIARLKSNGMVFDNEEKAKEILLDVGYYHLGFYFFPYEIKFPNLEHRDHKLKAGTTFKNVYDLYAFDTKLRRLLLNALERIEVNIRTKLIYKISLLYIDDPCWFVNRKYVTSKFVNSFEEQVYATMRKNPIIQHHHANHSGVYAPAWKTIEFMTIGNIIKLYDSLKQIEAKNLVAKDYGCSRGVFYNYMETIRVLRNKCAHGGCVYRMTFPKGIKRLPADVPKNCRHNIKGGIDVVKYMLGCISQTRKTELENDIHSLINSIETLEAQKVVAQTTKIENLNPSFLAE